MSADNGVYILKSKDGFRVAHLQCIENLYWWDTGHKNGVCPDRAKEMFGDCKVFTSQVAALKEEKII